MAANRRFTASGALAHVERVLRGGHNIYFELLGQAADNMVGATELLHRLLSHFPDDEGEGAAIIECEDRGDALVHELHERLNRESAAPTEQRDLLALFSALDDVVDLVDEVAAFLKLYSIEAPMIQAEELALVLRDAARELCHAVHRVARFEDIEAHVVEVHRLENEGDRLVRGAIASLFVEGIDPMVVIRWKDIFERIEDAIDSTERAAYVLEGVLIKNT
jgi:uncharacterized protein Yka (UPF0111/DUF47 family)